MPRTVCSTASCTSWSVTLTVVSRSACCTRISSSTIRRRTCLRAAARPAESVGTTTPCAWSDTSISSTCDWRIGLLPTIATMRSSDTPPPWPTPAAKGSSAAPVASTAARKARSPPPPPGRVIQGSARWPARDRRRARGGPDAGGGLVVGPGHASQRVTLRPQLAGPFGGAHEARLIDGPRRPGPQHVAEERRDRHVVGARHDDVVEVALDVSHSEASSGVRRPARVLENLRREAEGTLHPAQRRVVGGAQVDP